MASPREVILQRLFVALETAFKGSQVDLRRNEVLPTKIALRGMIILRDGDPGEPEHTFSPLLYHYEHRAQVEVFVQARGGLELLFDGLCQKVGAAVVADRTFGGLCQWAEAEAPVPDDTPVEGAPVYRAAVIGVRLHYAVSDPLI